MSVKQLEWSLTVPVTVAGETEDNAGENCLLDPVASAERPQPRGFGNEFFLRDF